MSSASSLKKVNRYNRSNPTGITCMTRVIGGRRVVHKWSKGYADLEIPSRGEEVEKIRARNASFLDADMIVAKTGKAAAIRLEVPLINRLGSFDDQVEAVRVGLRAIRRRIEISPRIELS